MKTRVFGVLTLVLGALTTAFGFVLPLFYINKEPSVQIICGADMPTYEFLLWQAGAFPVLFVLLGAALALTGLFSLIFNKSVSKNCAPKTSLIALALSVFGATGLNCFFFCFVCAAFGEKAAYPRAYPASAAGMIISLVAFLALIFWYVVERRKKISVFGVVCDVALSIVYLPFFTFALSYFMDFLQNVI